MSENKGQANDSEKTQTRLTAHVPVKLTIHSNGSILSRPTAVIFQQLIRAPSVLAREIVPDPLASIHAVGG